MNFIKHILPICLLILQAKTYGQPNAHSPLNISERKTTTLVFPYAIRAVDRGSREILAEKVKQAENVLKVKAAQPAITATNLTVITADGHVYEFDVSYQQSPQQMVYNVTTAHTSGKVQLAEQRYADQLAAVIGKMTGFPDRKLATDNLDDISLRLTGVFVYGNQLLLRLRLVNRAALAYTIDNCRFAIEDRHQSARTAAQRKTLTPFYAPEATDDTLPGMHERTLVYAFDQFTLGDQQQLHITLTEKNGGRTLQLLLRNKQLLQAAPIIFNH